MPAQGFGGSILEDGPAYLTLLIAGFFAIACWGSLEVYIITFRMFKSRHSLYYWSICAANTGVVTHATGTVVRLYGVVGPVPASILSNLGWWLMTMGQWLVLFSRLHLVMGPTTRKLRWILVALVAVFFAVQVPTSTLFVVSNARTPHKAALRRVFHIFEIAQLAIITLLEGAISGLYVYESSRVFKQLQCVQGPRVKTMFRQLLALFVLVVTLDISLMLTYYTGNFLIETTMKPVVYSIKLKVELFVLNGLISLIQTGPCHCQKWRRNEYLVAEGGHRVPLGVNTARRSSASGPGFLCRAVKLAGSAEPVRATTHIFDEGVQHVKIRESGGHSCASSRT